MYCARRVYWFISTVLWPVRGARCGHTGRPRMCRYLPGTATAVPNVPWAWRLGDVRLLGGHAGCHSGDGGSGYGR